MIWGAALLAASIAVPSLGGTAEDSCLALSMIAAMGAEDGRVMASAFDGWDEALTSAEVEDDIQARLVSAAYLSGYSQGLVFLAPAEVATNFLTACMSEGV